MPSKDSSSDSFPGKEATIALGVLTAVEEDEHVTQRQLASELGIALGLANTYLKRCIKKGLIKVAQVPARRYAYYLTPRGFKEKSRLTAEYFSQSFKLFRDARAQYGDLFEFCIARNWRNVALAGAGDLAEIALISAQEHGITPLGLIVSDQPVDGILGLQVRGSISDFAEIDAVVITDFQDPQEVYQVLAVGLETDRILHPRLLGIVPGRTESLPIEDDDEPASA